MKRIIVWGFAVFFVFSMISIIGCKKGADSISLGFIGPLTGDNADYGVLQYNSVKLAVEKRNAKGGIGGKPVTLIAEDSEGKPEKANTAVEKLISINRIHALLGGVFSGETLAIAPRANAEKLLMCTSSATHKDVTSKGEYIFRNVLSDQLQARVFAVYAKKILNLNTAAVLYSKNDYSQGLAEDFKRTFEANGGKVVAFESSLVGDKDFKIQLTKMKNLNPEALYLPIYTVELAQVIDQKEQLGIQSKILSADSFSNPEIYNLIGEKALGVTFANSAEDVHISAMKAEFIKEYEKQYGVLPDSFSCNAYDTANMIMDVLEEVCQETSSGNEAVFQLDKERVKESFRNIRNYDGVSGNITFLESGDATKNVGIYITELNEQGEFTYKQIGVYVIEGEDIREVR